MQSYGSQARGKHGVHRYRAETRKPGAQQALFRNYQLRHGVPDET
jgi:hypothetical protein